MQAEGGGKENSSLTTALPYKGMLQGLDGSMEDEGMGGGWEGPGELLPVPNGGHGAG